MKTRNYFWRTMYGMCIAAVVSLSCLSCSREEGGQTPENNTPNNKPDEEVKGDVSFTLETGGADGSGTSSSPIVVGTGDRLDLTISQESHYTDPDGTAHSCRPVATVKLHATTDTITAKDLPTLLTVKGDTDTRTSSEGSNPRRHLTTQTFTIGSQQIVFDLSHEVYSVVNSASKTVEMPYLKPGDARLGAADASEMRSGVSLSAISVRPLGQMRGMTVTDSTLYEVDVRFSLSLESVHTQSGSTTPLNFSVRYIGIVETTTELQDPEAGLSYSWSQGGVTLMPPLTWNATEQPTATLLLNQEATYTNMFGTHHSCHPEARLVLTASKDTTWTENVGQLAEPGVLSAPSVTSVGEHPTENVRSYNYVVSGQTLTFDLHWQGNCQVSDSDINEPVTMPNVRFGELTVKDVSVADRPDEEAEGRGLALYTVTTTFGLELISEGLTEDKREQIDIVVTCVAAMEPKLVKVTYKRDWEWVEPHDNMMLFYYAKVHRTRHYSNGKSYTDTFMDAGHIAGHSVGFGILVENPIEWEDGKLTLYDGDIHDQNIGDSLRFVTRTQTLYSSPDIELPIIEDELPVGFIAPIGKWDEYRNLGDRYYDNQNLELGEDVIVEGDVEPIPSNLRDRRPGWYVHEPCWRHYVRYLLYYIALSDGWIDDRRYDQYLLIDGYMINFLDKKLRPDPEVRCWREDISNGWVFHHEMRQKYLERNFYIAARDTVLLNP